MPVLCKRCIIHIVDENDELKRKVKYMIDFYDLLLGAAVLFLIYAAIKYCWKTKRFKQHETTEGICSEIHSTRFNFIVCINRYLYTYTVDGVSYKGEDSEGFWFIRNCRELANPVTVEYLKDRPEVSRLAAVTHKSCRTIILYAVVGVALFSFLLLSRSGIL